MSTEVYSKRLAVAVRRELRQFKADHYRELVDDGLTPVQ
jgi:hypothetical protein